MESAPCWAGIEPGPAWLRRMVRLLRAAVNAPIGPGIRDRGLGIRDSGFARFRLTPAAFLLPSFLLSPSSYLLLNSAPIPNSREEDPHDREVTGRDCRRRCRPGGGRCRAQRPEQREIFSPAGLGADQRRQ